MKITELINQLNEELNNHGDMEVILSKDEEGNEFKKAYLADTYVVVKDDPDFYPIEDPDEYEADELDSVLIIWP